MDRALAALAAAAIVLAVAFSGPGERARATCTSLGAYDFDTYEAFDNVGVYNTAIELAAAGLAVTSATTPAGEAHHLEYPACCRATGPRGRPRRRTRPCASRPRS